MLMVVPEEWLTSYTGIQALYLSSVIFIISLYPRILEVTERKACVGFSIQNLRDEFYDIRILTMNI